MFLSSTAPSGQFHLSSRFLCKKKTAHLFASWRTCDAGISSRLPFLNVFSASWSPSFWPFLLTSSLIYFFTGLPPRFLGIAVFLRPSPSYSFFDLGFYSLSVFCFSLSLFLGFCFDYLEAERLTFPHVDGFPKVTAALPSSFSCSPSDCADFANLRLVLPLCPCGQHPPPFVPTLLSSGRCSFFTFCRIFFRLFFVLRARELTSPMRTNQSSLTCHDSLSLCRLCCSDFPSLSAESFHRSFLDARAVVNLYPPFPLLRPFYPSLFCGYAATRLRIPSSVRLFSTPVQPLSSCLKFCLKHFLDRQLVGGGFSRIFFFGLARPIAWFFLAFRDPNPMISLGTSMASSQHRPFPFFFAWARALLAKLRCLAVIPCLLAEVPFFKRARLRFR